MAWLTGGPEGGPEMKNGNHNLNINRTQPRHGGHSQTVFRLLTPVHTDPNIHTGKARDPEVWWSLRLSLSCEDKPPTGPAPLWFLNSDWTCQNHAVTPFLPCPSPGALGALNPGHLPTLLLSSSPAIEVFGVPVAAASSQTSLCLPAGVSGGLDSWALSYVRKGRD